MSLKSKMSSLFQQALQHLRSLPVSIRVTLWYTLFLGILLVMFTGIVLHLAEDYERRESGKVLIRTVEKATTQKGKIDYHKKGVYLSLRNIQGDMIAGLEPEGMPHLPVMLNQGPKKVVINGQSYHYLDQPVAPKDGRLPERPEIWVRGILPDNTFTKQYQIFVITALIGFPLLLILIAAGGYKIIRHSFAPVQAISQAAKAIGETGDLSQRIPLGEGKDEIHQMGRTFNWMLGQLEEQLEREKRFTSDVSHELRTPTAVIMAESEFGKDYTDDVDEAKEEFNHIFQQSKRMSYLINQLLELSRLGNQKNVTLAAVNLSQLTAETLEDYQKLPAAQNLSWQAAIEPNITIQANDQLLLRMLGNYLDNAVKFAESTIQVTLAQEAGHVRLSVMNDGPGIPEQDMDKVWNRLFQSDPSRNKKQNMGLGLGLSFVAAAAKLQKAKVGATSKPGETVFWLEF